MRRLVLAMIVAAVAACGGDGGGSGLEAGDLQLQVTGPPVKAVVLRVAGPFTSISPPSGAQIYVEEEAGDTAIVVLVAGPGATLPPGAVASLEVSDVNQLSRYSISVTHAAGPSYEVLNKSLFQASVTP